MGEKQRGEEPLKKVAKKNGGKGDTPPKNLEQGPGVSEKKASEKEFR